MTNNILDNQATVDIEYQNNLDKQLEYLKLLLEEDNFQKVANLLLELHYADQADFLDNVNNKQYKNILPIISKKLNPHIFNFLSEANIPIALKAVGIKEAARLISELNIEDAIDIVDGIGSELRNIILDNMKADRKQQIIDGFKYPENTAGRILEKEFVSLKQYWTVGQALDYLRRCKVNIDFHAAVVTDHMFHPIGTVLVSKLVQSPRTQPLTELMNKEFMVAEMHTDIDEIAFVFKQYALTTVPVVNKYGKLMGTISINNMIYIIEERAENEILNLSGVNNGDIFYNLYISAKNRFPWLFVNLITACLTSMVIRYFDDTISKLVTLAVIMPIVASMGGNAGTQAMTVTVRAISNREINPTNSFRVVVKEVYTCLINGICLSLVGSLLIFMLFGDIQLSSVFAVSILINFILAGFLGSAIPILLNHLNIDPAAASSVLLTACTDAIGFCIFLSMSYFFLV